VKTILHVIDTTGPGGAETVFIDLATRLPREKYRAIVVIRGRGWVYEELCRRGINPVLLDAKGSFNWRYLLTLCKLIRRNKVDILQSHLLGSNVYCALAGLLTRRPVVATFHGTVDIGSDERYKKLKFLAINAGAQCVVAVTGMLRNDLIERTPLNPDRLKVIYNGIDTRLYLGSGRDSLRRQFHWPDDKVVIGSLGNIRPAKGYDILLRTAALLAEKSYACRFVIAGQGKGELYDSLLALRKELGLEEYVIFLGFIDDAAGFLAGIDLFLSTSISEGLPLSAIQAMVAELPLVVPRCGGYEELITDRDNGCLVEPGNPKAFAQTIEQVIDDVELRNRIAANARQHAIKTFALEEMLGAYEKVYDRVTG